MNTQTLLNRYKWWAMIYDRVLDPLFAFDRRAVIACLELTAGQSVLEVGIGTGLNLLFYPDFVTVSGVDISPHMLRNIPESLRDSSRFSFFCLNQNRFPFADDSFDAVLATYVLRVATDPDSLLAEVYRVLKIGGRFVVKDRWRQKPISTIDRFTHWLGWGKGLQQSDVIDPTKWDVVECSEALVFIKK